VSQEEGEEEVVREVGATFGLHPGMSHSIVFHQTSAIVVTTHHVFGGYTAALSSANLMNLKIDKAINKSSPSHRANHGHAFARLRIRSKPHARSTRTTKKVAAPRRDLNEPSDTRA
jgi:hypothetical protein